MKLLLLPIVTTSMVGCLERVLDRCQAPCKVPLVQFCI